MKLEVEYKMAAINLKYVNTYDPNDRLRRQCPELIQYKAMTKQDILSNNEIYTINEDTLNQEFTKYNIRRQNSPKMKEYKTEEDFINQIIKSLTWSGYFTVVNTLNRNIKKEESDKEEE